MAYDKEGNFFYEWDPERGIITSAEQNCGNCGRYLPLFRICRHQLFGDGLHTDPGSRCISTDASSGIMLFFPRDSDPDSKIWIKPKLASSPERI